MILITANGYNMRVAKSAPEHDPHFHIVEIGFSAPPAGLLFHHVDPEYVVHFVTHGKGLFNRVEVDATKGFLIAADDPFEYRFDESEPWEHYWFRLGGDSVASVLKSLGMPTESHIFDFTFFDNVRDEFDRLLFEKIDGIDISVYLLGLFYKTMSYYCATRPKTAETRTESYLRIAKQFVESHYNEDITVEDVARAANISSKYLYKLFTEKLGRSPKNYLTTTRLDRARIMLERGNLSIAEIARSVGYEHPNYFTASFGKLYGRSPAEHRMLSHIKNLPEKETEMRDNRTTLASAVYDNYHASRKIDGNVVDPGRLADLIERIHSRLDALNAIDEFPDLPYDHPNARELWFAASCGCFDEFPDGNICPTRELTDSELVEALILLVPDFDKLIEIFAKASSKLARASALYLYKLSRAALSDDRYDDTQKKRLSVITDAMKAHIRSLGEITDVVGSKEDPINYICRCENGPFVREVKIESNKPGTPPVELVQISDLHYNFCNEADLAEANPSLMSTLEYRKWLANGSSVPAVRRALDFADASDLTIVTGDILDYLSLGGRELTVRELFRRDLTLMACPGGHDLTRVMQGKVPDPTTLESRYEILKSFWCNPVRYSSRILGEKVMAIVLDNDCGRYTPDQYEKLSIDLALARRDSLVVLIFQHEQMCTSNPADTDVPYIRAGDTSGSFDFSPGGRFIGSACRSEDTNRFYELIRSSGDVIKGIFCGHWHNDMYTEIITPNGGVIPQYVLTACPYDGAGHVIKITVE